MILNMDMEKCNIQMVEYIKDNGEMAFRMEQAYLYKKKGLPNKVYGLKVN